MRTPCADDPAAGVSAREMQLRRQLAEIAFSNPEEGANDQELAAGFILRLTYALTRKIDWPALQATREELASMGVSLDGLVEMKPTLRVAVYKALPAAARRVVDNALTISPAAPRLEVVHKKG